MSEHKNSGSEGLEESGEKLVSRFSTCIRRLTLKAEGQANGAAGADLRSTVKQEGANPGQAQPLADIALDLLAPVDPDALLDDPVVEQRYKADNYLPYWPIIWPSGLMLANRILRACGSPPEAPADAAAARAIDLGCGLGTTGIAAGLRGWHVTFTDYDPEAIEFAAYNARRNGIPESCIRALHMDWRSPLAETFPWVLASDVLYERRLHPLLLGAVDKLLAPGGQAWVSDPQRTSAEDFPLAAVACGFKVTTLEMEGESFAGGRQVGQLYVLTRK